MESKHLKTYDPLKPSDEMNLKMLMTSVPGVPGEDYPILADVQSAGDTGFSCQGKIVGGEYWL